MKLCRYGCGTELEWSDARRKFVEKGTNTWHSYPRCKNLLLKQGRQVPFDVEYHQHGR